MVRKAKNSPSSSWDIGPNIITGYNKKIFSMVTPIRNLALQTSCTSPSWYDQLQGMKHFTSRLVSHVGWYHRQKNLYYWAFLLIKVETVAELGFKLTTLRLQVLCSTVVPIVTQSHTGLHDTPIENSTHELARLSSLFSAFRKCLKLQNWY